jgi:GT2 family glycosyltransferase
MQMQEQVESGLPRVAVVVLNWNGRRDTIECSESLLKVKDVDFEIILIDNGSTDDSIKVIENCIESHNIPKFKFSLHQAQKLAIDESRNNRIGVQRVVLYSLQENIGFCVDNNLGLRHALANGIPYALILNNDTLVDSKFLSSLVEYAQTHPDAGLIGDHIRYADDPKMIWWMGLVIPAIEYGMSSR